MATILLFIIFLIAVTLALFAPQVLATGLNVVIQGVEILAMIILTIPATVLYAITFTIWILLLVLDAGLEYVHDITIGQIQQWISLGQYNPWTTDDVPDISYSAYQIMLQVRSWIMQKPYFGRVEIPKQSFAQQIIDTIAAMGVPQPIPYIILFSFIALVFILAILAIIRAG